MTEEWSELSSFVGVRGNSRFIFPLSSDGYVATMDGGEGLQVRRRGSVVGGCGGLSIEGELAVEVVRLSSK